MSQNKQAPPPAADDAGTGRWGGLDAELSRDRDEERHARLAKQSLPAKDAFSAFVGDYYWRTRAYLDERLFLEKRLWVRLLAWGVLIGTLSVLSWAWTYDLSAQYEAFLETGAQ